MPIALKRLTVVVDAPAPQSPWMHVVWFSAAGLLISILAMTYGLDLSPGLF